MHHPEASLRRPCSRLFTARQKAHPLAAGRADLLLHRHRLVKCSQLRPARPFLRRPRKLLTHLLLACRAARFSQPRPARSFPLRPRKLCTHLLLACRAARFSQPRPARSFPLRPRKLCTHLLLACRAVKSSRPRLLLPLKTNQAPGLA
jgi:hypothetical protein